MHHHVGLQSFESSHLLSRIDPRVKLVNAIVLLAMVLSSPGLAFPLVVCGLALGLCLNLGVPHRTLVVRFSEPAFIAVMVLLLKLFFAGSMPLFTVHLAGLQLVGYRDGLMEGLHIASRIAAGVAVLAVVGFSTPFTELMAALSWLRVPQVLIDVALFAWRYLFLLFEDAQVVYHSQRNRLGYAGYRRGLRSFGTLAGVLVIKAFDNSQSITTAMVQRGYDGAMPMLLHKPFVKSQVVFSLLFILGMGIIRAI